MDSEIEHESLPSLVPQQLVYDGTQYLTMEALFSFSGRDFVMPGLVIDSCSVKPQLTHQKP